ncbi:MAG TPA: NADH-quinone oxidoreductase subunit NuoE [Chloroflexi bacterium]|nr:NADH-quinone oxidoreductase subunit NuoE [Chloroflexota bacterium]
MEHDFDLTRLDQIVEEAGAEKGSLIPVLQKAQGVYGYLPPKVLRSIADRLGVALSKVYGVATFYSQFHLTPRGRHIIQQCDGTACHVRGAARIIKAVEQELGIKAGETTPDLKCTYEVVYCIGSCALAPTAIVDDHVAGRLTPERMLSLIEHLD